MIPAAPGPATQKPISTTRIPCNGPGIKPVSSERGSILSEDRNGGKGADTGGHRHNLRVGGVWVRLRPLPEPLSHAGGGMGGGGPRVSPSPSGEGGRGVGFSAAAPGGGGGGGERGGVGGGCEIK